MLGGAIKRPSDTTPVIVRHSEEVVVTADKKIPLPKDHLTGVELTPDPTSEHPVRLINLTQGIRTQLTEGDFVKGGTSIKFKNPAAGINDEGKEPEAGDHIRIFWEEEVKNANGTSAVEVTISPDTFPGT